MGSKSPSPGTPTGETCDHGLPLFPGPEDRLCALEYLNRYVAPMRVARVTRNGQRLFLTFDTGDKLECCCESCGESHGDDRGYVEEVKEISLGRRAMRFRLDPEAGNLIIWFARGDHLHLHRNSLARFRPQRRRSRAPRQVRPRHTPSTDSNQPTEA